MKKLSFLLLIFALLLCGCSRSTEEGFDASEDNGIESEMTVEPEAVADGESEPEWNLRVDAETDELAQNNRQHSGSETEWNPRVDAAADEFVQDNQRQYEEYQGKLADAEVLEAHLRAVLSPADYGGIHIAQHETVTMKIYVVSREAVNAAVRGFSGEPFMATLVDTRCSLQDLTDLQNALEQIETEAGEQLAVYLSEEDNSLSVNISETGEERLRQEISEQIQGSRVPEECVYVHMILTSAENPVT